MEGFQQQQNQQRANKVLETKLKKKIEECIKNVPTLSKSNSTNQNK